MSRSGGLPSVSKVESTWLINASWPACGRSGLVFGLFGLGSVVSVVSVVSVGFDGLRAALC